MTSSIAISTIHSTRTASHELQEQQKTSRNNLVMKILLFSFCIISVLLLVNVLLGNLMEEECLDKNCAITIPKVATETAAEKNGRRTRDSSLSLEVREGKINRREEKINRRSSKKCRNNDDDEDAISANLREKVPDFETLGLFVFLWCLIKTLFLRWETPEEQD